MVVDVIPHEGGDHVVRVIVQRLQPHLARIPGLGGSSSKVLWLQLVSEESIRSSLINQNAGLGTRVAPDKLCGVIGLPRLYRAQVSSESLRRRN